jgi:hypothetical protein
MNNTLPIEKQSDSGILRAIQDRATGLSHQHLLEVYDFVNFLLTREGMYEDLSETEWRDFSLAQAMRGMEDESDLYRLGDLKERWR